MRGSVRFTRLIANRLFVKSLLPVPSEELDESVDIDVAPHRISWCQKSVGADNELARNLTAVIPVHASPAEPMQPRRSAELESPIGIGCDGNVIAETALQFAAVHRQ